MLNLIILIHFRVIHSLIVNSVTLDYFIVILALHFVKGLCLNQLVIPSKLDN